MRLSKTRNRMRLFYVVATSLVLASTGCVSVRMHDKLTEERDTLKAKNRSLEADLSQKNVKVNQLQSTRDGLVASLQDEIAAGSVEIEQLRNGILVNLSQDILFDSGSIRLGSSGASVLKKVASQLRGSRSRIDIVGHTDNVQISPGLRSRFSTNWELAGARAASVVKLMQEEGISGSRLQAVSGGPFAPRVSNDSKMGRSKNRRIEIRLFPASSDSMQYPASPN